MDLQKINVKLFSERADALSLPAFIEVFNGWIQAAEGEYYDIADYSHVAEGPGIVLVADEANISMDNGGGRLGLLYNQKRPLQGSNRERLRFVFKKALATCVKLEGARSLAGRFTFEGNEAHVCINDRLSAPNTEETFQAVADDLDAFAQLLFAGSSCSVERYAQDPRERFSVCFKAQEPFSISTLLKNLD